MHIKLRSILVFATWSTLAMAQDHPPFRAGAASVSINPPLGSYIAGDAQNRTFTGVNDDIFAKAVVFDDGTTAMAIVTVDCIGLIRPTIERIRTESAVRAGLSRLTPERIIVASTHCHSGPDVVGIWGPDRLHSGVDQQYMEQLIDKTVAQVARAAAALQPATVRAVSLESQVDWVRNSSEPGELDKILSVMKVETADGGCITTLINFACHPTILDGVHDVVSSDWVGGVYRGMADALSGEHLFLQGAVGGWVQPEKGDRSFGLADRYGRELAAEALDALKNARQEQNPDIAFSRISVSFPMDNPAWGQLGKLGIIPRAFDDAIETEVAAFRIGKIGFATHPGETAPTYSRQTRALLDVDTTFVIGLGLDALGYIVKPEYFTNPDAYSSADYLTSMSAGPQTGPLMMRGLAQATATLGGR